MNPLFHSTRRLIVVVIFLTGCSTIIPQRKIASDSHYTKYGITQARYGDSELRTWLDKAYDIRPILDQKVFGQERATYALQEALIQYYQSYGTRTREPVALHFIGLPGIGKSVLIDELFKQGFPVEKLDMQAYSNDNSSGLFSWHISQIIDRNRDRPYILVLDELDKIPEITSAGEKTFAAIAEVNEILTDGSLNGQKLSNALVITTMNFSPTEIESFSQEILGSKKSYYAFSLEDFAKFDRWLSENPGARYQVLSRLFRTNTVSRLAPNTTIFKPLNIEDYKKIAINTINQTISRVVNHKNSATRIQVQATESFAAFLSEKTIVPASGARESVFRVDRLTDQVIGLAMKYNNGDEQSLARPRAMLLDTDPETGQVRVTVTPHILRGKKLMPQEPFSFALEYRNDVRLFDRPTAVQARAPEIPIPKFKTENPLSRANIIKNRFPKATKLAKGLANRLNEVIIGQEHYTALLEEEMNKYLSRPGPALKQPSLLVLAGFPGIGKSELINRAAIDLNLPVVRIGMQQYTADESKTVIRFAEDLSKRIQEAEKSSPTGKYIVLIEELDKVFEINPVDKMLASRPVMGLIKDMIADGFVSISGESSPFMEAEKPNIEINLRNAYSVVTMNFGADLFGFEADPRLTTAEDTVSAWRRLSTRPADLKEVLGKIFLPETISRLMPHFHIMKPLSISDYQKLIRGITEQVIAERMIDPKSKLNLSQVEVKLTSNYRKYLLDETMIPSEGARYTVMAARSRILTDIEFAFEALKSKEKYRGKPLVLTLDFNSTKSLIRYQIKANDEIRPSRLSQREITLTYPRPEQSGYLDEFRTLVSVHEFGHAFSAVRSGLRFETISVISPATGTGGYVKYSNNGMSARARIADLYSTIAARAMERIFYSDDPLSETSVHAVTDGASGDFQQATENLLKQIYFLGFDPNGGNISRSEHTHLPGGMFGLIPDDKVDALGRVLRGIEDDIILDFLSAHPIEWYREKIGSIGRAGILNENGFYNLIGYTYPDPSFGFLGNSLHSQKSLKGLIKPHTPNQQKALDLKQSLTKTTARENLDVFIRQFQKNMAKNLHGIALDECSTNLHKLIEQNP